MAIFRTAVNFLPESPCVSLLPIQHKVYSYYPSCLLYTSKIAAAEGCTAIIGVDAHNNQYLETPFYYDRANERLRALGIKVIAVSYTHLARHYPTGEVLPDELIQRLVDASNFNVAYACLRQISFVLLDMAWYTRNVPFEGDVKVYEQEAWKKKG